MVCEGKSHSNWMFENLHLIFAFGKSTTGGESIQGISAVFFGETPSATPRKIFRNVPAVRIFSTQRRPGTLGTSCHMGTSWGPKEQVESDGERLESKAQTFSLE